MMVTMTRLNEPGACEESPAGRLGQGKASEAPETIAACSPALGRCQEPSQTAQTLSVSCNLFGSFNPLAPALPHCARRRLPGILTAENWVTSQRWGDAAIVLAPRKRIRTWTSGHCVRSGAQADRTQPIARPGHPATQTANSLSPRRLRTSPHCLLSLTPPSPHGYLTVEPLQS